LRSDHALAFAMRPQGLRDPDRSFLFRNGHRSMLARNGLVEIDGQVITTRNLTDSVGAIVRRLGGVKSFLVCTLNLDHLVKLRADSRFRDAYAKAEIVMPDGFPIVAFARME